jgi:hypothetical protein
VADFPPPETGHIEYYMEAKVENENEQGVELKFTIHIEPCLPPRLESGFEARYYLDIDELLTEGKTISSIKTQVYYDEQGMLYGGPSVVLEAPVAVDEANGIYYIPVNWGSAEMVGKRELQFVIQIIQDYTIGGSNPVWDGTNDYSRQGLGGEYSESPRIPIFKDGVLVYGEPVPGDDTTPTPTPSATPTPTQTTPPGDCPFVNGDVDGDDSIDIVDALLIARFYVHLNPDGFEECAADVNGDGNVTITDALLVAQCYVNLIPCQF